MGRLTHFKGRIKRWVGEATGDRQVEAVGEIERRSGREPADDRAKDAATEAIRYKHGDRQ
jgi:uncharacterized protein YjbJ (UPF0337 family)